MNILQSENYIHIYIHIYIDTHMHPAVREVSMKPIYMHACMHEYTAIRAVHTYMHTYIHTYMYPAVREVSMQCKPA